MAGDEQAMEPDDATTTDPTAGATSLPATRDRFTELIKIDTRPQNWDVGGKVRGDNVPPP